MMKVDLHLHTSPRSPCSTLAPEDAVSVAARHGLDAVCLTEHHVLWSRDELDRLTELAGIRVFGGTEVTTDHGDVLVFGLLDPPRYGIPIAELRRSVQQDGGVMIAAHPFRGSRFSNGFDAMHPRQAAELPVFGYVDAVEVWNGCESRTENDLAARVARHLRLPGVAGSDAHSVVEVGSCCTVLEGAVDNERELVEALRSGSFSIEVAGSSG